MPPTSPSIPAAATAELLARPIALGPVRLATG